MTTLRLLALLAALLASTAAKGIELTSGATRLQVVELYTSEGCSSCPPADRWLSQLRDHDLLWMRFLPVALHVDYWNYLGWKDPFASAEFSSRQRAYAAEQRVKAVYTPGFVVDGQEWRGWFSREALPPAPGDTAGILALSTDDEQFTATYSGDGGQRLLVGWLGFDIVSWVRAGENRGSRLTHDFVLLAHRSYDGASQWSGELPPRPETGERLALVAWVSGQGPAPLQAVGGWYPR